MKTKRLNLVLLLTIAVGFTACAPATKEDPEAAAAKERVAMMEKNKMVVQKLFTIIQTNAVDSLNKYVSDNMVEHSPVPNGAATGVQSQKDAIAFYYSAFPDWKFTIISLVAEGDLVVAHFNVKATNSGPIGTMPATNKPVDVNGVDIYKIENGKSTEHWGYFEEMKMMAQLGATGEQKADAKKK